MHLLGNEGTTSTFTYNRTALVLIPWDFKLDLLDRYSDEATFYKHIETAMEAYKSDKSAENKAHFNAFAR